MVKLLTESQFNNLIATSRSIQIFRKLLDLVLPHGSKLKNIIMSLDGKRRENTNVMSSHSSALMKMVHAHAQMVTSISVTIHSLIMISKTLCHTTQCLEAIQLMVNNIVKILLLVIHYQDIVSNVGVSHGKSFLHSILLLKVVVQLKISKTEFA